MDFGLSYPLPWLHECILSLFDLIHVNRPSQIFSSFDVGSIRGHKVTSQMLYMQKEKQGYESTSHAGGNMQVGRNNILHVHHLA